MGRKGFQVRPPQPLKRLRPLARPFRHSEGPNTFSSSEIPVRPIMDLLFMHNSSTTASKQTTLSHAGQPLQLFTLFPPRPVIIRRGIIYVGVPFRKQGAGREGAPLCVHRLGVLILLCVMQLLKR